MLDDIELFNNFGNDQKILESDINNKNVRFHLGEQMHNEEMKDSCWNLHQIN